MGEFIEEQEFFQKQHQAGWKLVSTNGYKHCFEACDKENWIYQFDYKDDGKADDAYKQLFNDCGWEFVIQYQYWCCFRRKNDGVVNVSIFSSFKLHVITQKCKIQRICFRINRFPVYLSREKNILSLNFRIMMRYINFLIQKNVIYSFKSARSGTCI